jgi:hypothetical protein
LEGTKKNKPVPSFSFFYEKRHTKPPFPDPNLLSKSVASCPFFYEKRKEERERAEGQEVP